MKIVCDSCKAKYSIADEKVAGKTFRIRCKRCGSAIIVRGEGLGPAEPAEAAAPGAGGAGADPTAIWHVVMNGSQQGPYPLEKVQEMLATGVMARDGYVWREGFDGWVLARDVPELAGEEPPPPTAEAPADTGPAAATDDVEDDVAAGAPAYGDVFGTHGEDAEVANRRSRDAGADLFAPAPAPAAGGFAAAADDGDVVASAPSSPRPTGAQGPALTGQRNETSVLFSLQNLQALATGGESTDRGAPAGPAASPGSAPGAGPEPYAEGSGLIDIRALAGAQGAVGNRPASDKGVEELMSIGSGSPGMGSGLAQPVLAPAAEPKDKNKGVIAAVIGAAVVLAGAGIAAAFILRPSPAEIAQAPLTGAPGTATPPEAEAPAAAADDGDEEGDAAEAPAAADADAEEKDEAPAAKTKPGRRGGRASGGTREAAAAAPTPPRSRPRSGGNDIDSLLDRAVEGGGARQAEPEVDPNLPDTPSRENVARALRSVEDAVKACGQGEHGIAMTQVTVSGSNGRVTRAVVQGAFAGTPVGSCVARTVRGARFERFKRPTFTVTFPYRL